MISIVENWSADEERIDSVTRFQLQSSGDRHIVPFRWSERNANANIVDTKENAIGIVHFRRWTVRTWTSGKTKVVNTADGDSEDASGQVHRSADVEAFYFVRNDCHIYWISRLPLNIKVDPRVAAACWYLSNFNILANNFNCAWIKLLIWRWLASFIFNCSIWTFKRLISEWNSSDLSWKRVSSWLILASSTFKKRNYTIKRLYYVGYWLNIILHLCLEQQLH